MRAFSELTAIAVPLDRANVDTDSIIPKQFLKSIEKTGFGANLFDAWRYLDHGEPGADNTKRPLNRAFVLNHDDYRNAGILLARSNFGCGSSREHAVWALLDYGIRVAIAPSFGDIFYNNSFNNGLLAITLPEAQVDALFRRIAAAPGLQLHVDLASQTVAVVGDSRGYNFALDASRKHCLQQGLDEIGRTLQYADDIRAYENTRRRQAAWLFAAAPHHD